MCCYSDQRYCTATALASFEDRFSSVPSLASYEHRTRARRYPELAPNSMLLTRSERASSSSYPDTGTYGCGPPRLILCELVVYMVMYIS